jgi:TolB protein
MTRSSVLRLIAALGAFITAHATASPVHDLVLRTYHPVRVVVQDFVAGTLSEAEAARAISQTIASDLKQSGKFELIDHLLFAEKYASVDETPEFSDWRAIDAQGLIVGRASRQTDGRIKVEFRLFNVPGRAQIAGQIYTGERDDIGRIGHMISADIYERVTGERRTFQIP